MKVKLQPSLIPPALPPSSRLLTFRDRVLVNFIGEDNYPDVTLRAQTELLASEEEGNCNYTDCVRGEAMGEEECKNEHADEEIVTIAQMN